VTDIRKAKPESPAEPQPSGLDDLSRAFHMHEEVYDEADPAERRYWLVVRLNRLNLVLGYSPYVGELIEALMEVDRGTLLPLFEPIPNGRPKMRLTEQEIQSRAALAMEALMLGGMTKEQAARKVANALGYASYDPIGREKVAQWRDDLARAARGTGNYSEDYRGLASLYLEDRDRLRAAVKLHLQDPMNLAAQELERLDWLRRLLD
jgi:hypothetical protein